MLHWLKKHLFNIPDNISMTDDYTRYKVMFYFVVTPSILLTFILGTFAVFEKETLLGIMDFSLTALFIAFFAIARADLFLKKIIVLSFSITIIFYISLFTLGLGRNQSFIWYYSIPVISFFFFGRRKGLIISLFIIFITFLIVLFSEYIPFYSQYPDGLLFRFFLSYLFIMTITYIYEITRYQTKTELEKTMMKLKQETIIDCLTQLNNRRYFDNIIDLIYRQSKGNDSVALIMADLDYFKQYNDNYGHIEGDIVLQKFAEVLRNNLRRNTDYAFRYGGEEFTLLLNYASEETAEKITSDIIKDTEKLNIPHKGSPFGIVTVSAGITFLRNISSSSKQDFIRSADEVLYKAKNSGRNCYMIRSIYPD